MNAGGNRQYRGVSWLVAGILLAALPSVAAAQTPGSAPAPAEPLPSLTRKLVYVNIVKTKAGYVHVPEEQATRPQWLGLPRANIISVHGRSPTDIWLLTEDQVVLHDDGKRIVDRYAGPCGWGQYNREFNGVGTKFYQIVADKDFVHVIGESRGENTRVGGEVRASISKNGKWSCTEDGLVPAAVMSSGDMTWKVAHNMAGDMCRIGSSTGFCTPGPRWAPSFSEPVGDSIDMGIHSFAPWMYGLDDGWILTIDETGWSSLHRFNGVTWAPVGKIKIRVMDLWADMERNVWITARKKGGQWNDPANTVLRFDGKELRTFPVPESFKTYMVRGTGPRDVWFIGGGNQIYQWDGTTLRQGVLNFAPTDAWASLNGEVWIVGEDGVAHTAPLGEAR